jgi:glycosyltransferase involved in cell wall biosynthesis
MKLLDEAPAPAGRIDAPATGPALLPLSVFVITKNEADRVGPVLAAVRDLTDDLLVIDSQSTDGTIEIAERYGARVLQNPWAGYGPQKRFGEAQCRHPWILNVDADEEASAELVAEIRALFAQGEPPLDGYIIAKPEVFPGEGAPHPWTYAPTQLRLYRRDKGSYSESTVHDDVVMRPGARVGHLKGVLIHRSVRSLGDQIAKLNRYTDMQVEDLARRGKRIGAWRLPFEFPLAFLRAYVVRRHALRGVYGFATAINFAFVRHLRLAKHLERRKLEEARRAGRR